MAVNYTDRLNELLVRVDRTNGRVVGMQVTIERVVTEDASDLGTMMLQPFEVNWDQLATIMHEDDKQAIVVAILSSAGMDMAALVAALSAPTRAALLAALQA